jgi:hypothetical protein
LILLEVVMLCGHMQQTVSYQNRESNMSAKSCFVICLITIASIGACSGQVKKSGDDALLETLLSFPKRILAGGDVNRNDTLIAHGARLLSGSLNVDLQEVVAGKSASFSLVEDTSWQGVGIRLKTNDNDDSAFMVLTTAKRATNERRYHTIVLMKDKAGVWRVENWNRTP